MNGIRTLGMFILLLIVPTVNAAAPVTYTCCVNFETSNGTLLEGFGYASEWTNSGAGSITPFNDSNHSMPYLIGGNGTGFGTNGAVTVNMYKPVNFYIYDKSNFQLWLYIENRSTTSRVQLILSNNTGVTKYYYYNFERTELREGWNKLSFNPKDPTGNIGAMNLTDRIVRMRFNLINSAGLWSNITLANFRYDIVARPKVMFTFDDNDFSVYQNATSVFDAAGYQATMFVPTDFINPPETDKMTLAQMHELYAKGWDMASHTVTHPHLNTLTHAQQETELVNAKTWLIANGFVRGSEIVAYPSGDYNNDTIDIVNGTYLLGRTSDNGTWSSHIEATDIDNITYTLNTKFLAITKPEQWYFDDINRTINSSSALILTAHDVRTGGIMDGTMVTAQNLTNITNYLALRSADIDVIKMSDYIIKHVPNNTPIIGKTVNISSNGSAYIVVDNFLNDVTVNMSVSPSSDSVNVTVTTWTTSGYYNKIITASSNTHNNPTTYIMGDFPANTYTQLYKNGIFSGYYLSNASGYISFSHSEYSDVIIEALLAPSALEAQICPSVNNDVNVTFQILGVLLMVFSAVLLVQGIRTMQYPFLIAGIATIIVGSIMLVVGYFVTVTVSNGVGCLGP